MFTPIKKMFVASFLILVISITGIWQSDHIVLAESQNASIPETPLYPGLTWNDLGSSAQDIRININEDSISLSGERYEAEERFAVGFPPQDVLNYYSNKELAKSGWTSYDTVEVNGGIHYIFFHDSGVYLSVEYILCPGSSSTICVAVWKSDQTKQVVSSLDISGQENIMTATSTFGKKTPANGATNLDPASVVLSWNAYSPAPDKYSYCVKVGSACEDGDPDWTSAYNTSITLTNLALNTTYYWQVKAITCVSCVPKTVVYADNGATWTFKTKAPDHAVIMGNAGLAGAVLSYTDYTLKTVTADGYGNYSITVPFNWSGTVTPSKSGYAFSPKYASFSNLTAPLTIQNFNATPGYTISGSIGLSGVTLSYTDGAPQTVVSNSDGTYSITVPSNWSGTVTPSKTGFTFTPVSKSYSNIMTNFTAQNYGVLVSLSGHVGVAGATLSYVDGTVKTITADGSGNYSITVPFGWSGTVTPYKSGYIFTPINRLYTGLQASQTSQDYTVQACASCADVNVTIGGDSQGNYTLGSGEERRLSFNVSGGPVKVESSDPSKKIVTAIRLQSYVNNTLYSFAETMGVPSGLLSYKYYFPSYNNIWGPLNSQIRFSNLDANPTTIRVTIGGNNVWEQQVLGGEEKRLSFDVSGGPVIIESLDPAKKIAAAIRLQSYANNTLYSFAETMGIPAEQVSNTYYFPSYNNIWAPLNSQLRIGNLDVSDVTVRVTIGGDIVWEDVVPGLDEKRLSFNVSGGPVKVESLDPDPSKKIVTAIRLQSYANNTLYSFAETMGVPSGLLSYKYYFPSYNNIWAPLNSQIRFSNLDANPTTIRVTIGGNNVWEQQVLGGEEKRLSFDVSGGPVIIESLDPAKKIAAAIRLQSYADNTLYSFAETMGIPAEWMSNTYYFPSYNNIWAPLNSQLRFGLP